MLNYAVPVYGCGNGTLWTTGNDFQKAYNKSLPLNRFVHEMTTYNWHSPDGASVDQCVIDAWVGENCRSNIYNYYKEYEG